MQRIWPALPVEGDGGGGGGGGTGRRRPQTTPSPADLAGQPQSCAVESRIGNACRAPSQSRRDIFHSVTEPESKSEPGYISGAEVGA